MHNACNSEMLSPQLSKFAWYFSSALGERTCIPCTPCLRLRTWVSENRKIACWSFSVALRRMFLRSSCQSFVV